MKWEYCWGESIFAHRYQSGFPHAGNMPRSLVFQLILITFSEFGMEGNWIKWLPQWNTDELPGVSANAH